MTTQSQRRVPRHNRVRDADGNLRPLFREKFSLLHRFHRWDSFATRRERTLVKTAALAAFPLGLAVAPFAARFCWEISQKAGRLPTPALLVLSAVPPLAILAPTLAAVFYLFAPVMNRAIARAWLSEGRCGSCGYHFTSIPPDLSGRRRCPECGAAWDRDASPGE